MVDQDELKDDPFFRLPADSDWNACIGKQGTEENYLDGYIEAAMELVNTVIEKKMLEKRDTVVLPILYNARHAVELMLKFTTHRLVEIGVLSHVLGGPIMVFRAIWIYWSRLTLETKRSANTSAP